MWVAEVERAPECNASQEIRVMRIRFPRLAREEEFMREIGGPE